MWTPGTPSATIEWRESSASNRDPEQTALPRDGGRIAARAKIRRQIRRWQKQCEAPASEEAPGQQLSAGQMAALEKRLEEIPRGLDVYVPDSVQARELNRGKRVLGAAPVRHPEHRRMRQKLRDPAGRAIYQRRKAILEPVIGVLKEQRGMRQFRRRGMAKVAVELALAATAFNLTRWWHTKPTLEGTP